MCKNIHSNHTLKYLYTLYSSPKIIAKSEKVTPTVIAAIKPTTRWGNSGLLSFKSLANDTW